MSRPPFLAALIFTAAVAMWAAGASAWSLGRFTWGQPEFPKAQCEALDSTKLSPVVRVALANSYQARVATAIIREPQNTWSNLAFVFVGALIWSRDPRFFARLLAAALIALGLASGLYHASLLPSWRTVDVATMGWVSFTLCCVGFEAARGGKPDDTHATAATLCFGLIGSVAAIIAAVFRNDVRIAGIKPFDSTYTTVAGVAGVFLLAVIGLVRAARAHPGQPYPIARIATLAALVGVAAFFQINDRPGRLCCAPDGLIQGHAVWHILMAAASLLGYDLFRVLAGRPGLFARG